jgi:gamma-glutamyltranspeptidase/glutathione hydrolase
VEVAKLAFADREAWYGDSDDVPLDALLDPAYLAERAALVGDEAATDLRPGSPGGRVPRLPKYVSSPDSIEADPAATDAMVAVERPTPQGEARGDTCHIDVVDRWGNMVSATPSGGWLQSSPIIPELGFPLGTRAQMFWLEQDLPDSLAPGKRPRTTLSPTLAVRDRDGAGIPRRAWAFGTPGGDQQDQWQLLLLLGHVVDGLNLQAAIDAPAWHTNDLPSSFAPRRRAPRQLVAESSLGARCLDGLRERGHRVVEAAPWSLGRLSAVTRDADTGLLRAAANPRGAQGYAAGR